MCAWIDDSYHFVAEKTKMVIFIISDKQIWYTVKNWKGWIVSKPTCLVVCSTLSSGASFSDIFGIFQNIAEKINN